MYGNHYILSKSNPPLRVLTDRNVITAHNSFKTSYSFLQDERSDDNLLIVPNRTQDFERRLDLVTSDMNSVKSDMNSVKSDMTSVKAEMNSVKSDINSLKSDMNSVKSSIEQILSALKPPKIGVEEVSPDSVTSKTSINPFDQFMSKGDECSDIIMESSNPRIVGTGSLASKGDECSDIIMESYDVQNVGTDLVTSIGDECSDIIVETSNAQNVGSGLFASKGDECSYIIMDGLDDLNSFNGKSNDLNFNGKSNDLNFNEKSNDLNFNEKSNDLNFKGKSNDDLNFNGKSNDDLNFNGKSNDDLNFNGKSNDIHGFNTPSGESYEDYVHSLHGENVEKRTGIGTRSTTRDATSPTVCVEEFTLTKSTKTTRGVSESIKSSKDDNSDDENHHKENNNNNDQFLPSHARDTLGNNGDDGDDDDDDDKDDDASDISSLQMKGKGKRRETRTNSTPLVQIVRNPDFSIPYNYLGVSRMSNLLAVMEVQNQMEAERESLRETMYMNRRQVQAYRRIERYLAKDEAEFAQMKTKLSLNLVRKKIHYIRNEDDKLVQPEDSEFVTKPHLVSMSRKDLWRGEELKDDDSRFLTQAAIKAMSRWRSKSFKEPYLWFSLYFQLKLGDITLFMGYLHTLIRDYYNHLQSQIDWFGFLDTIENIFGKGDFYGWHFQDDDGLWHRESPECFRLQIMPSVDALINEYMNKMWTLRDPWNFNEQRERDLAYTLEYHFECMRNIIARFPSIS